MRIFYDFLVYVCLHAKKLPMLLCILCPLSDRLIILIIFCVVFFHLQVSKFTNKKIKNQTVCTTFQRLFGNAMFQLNS